jgi:hypothetical protein
VVAIRKSNRSDRAVAVGLVALGAFAWFVVGCPAPAPPPLSPVDVPPAARHPDGVLIEPPTPIPSAADRADARGVVALREPLPDEAVQSIVSQYLRGWTSESLDSLEQLLTTDAVTLDGAHQSRGQLRESWRARMQSLDYKKLAGVQVARLDRIERFEFADLGVPGAPPRPPEMQRGDVLARVPIASARVGAEQLFPDVLVLLLRREEGRYRIAGVGELAP